VNTVCTCRAGFWDVATTVTWYVPDGVHVAQAVLERETVELLQPVLKRRIAARSVAIRMAATDRVALVCLRLTKCIPHGKTKEANKKVDSCRNGLEYWALSPVVLTVTVALPDPLASRVREDGENAQVAPCGRPWQAKVKTPLGGPPVKVNATVAELPAATGTVLLSGVTVGGVVNDVTVTSTIEGVATAARSVVASVTLTATVTTPGSENECEGNDKTAPFAFAIPLEVEVVSSPQFTVAFNVSPIGALQLRVAVTPTPTCTLVGETLYRRWG
jgi:hypothetical protein